MASRRCSPNSCSARSQPARQGQAVHRPEHIHVVSARGSANASREAVGPSGVSGGLRGLRSWLRDFVSCHRFPGSRCDQDQGVSLCFVLVSQRTGTVIGTTRFMDIALAHKRLEIGATWITPPIREQARTSKPSCCSSRTRSMTWESRRSCSRRKLSTNNHAGRFSLWGRLRKARSADSSSPTPGEPGTWCISRSSTTDGPPFDAGSSLDWRGSHSPVARYLYACGSAGLGRSVVMWGRSHI